MAALMGAQGWTRASRRMIPALLAAAIAAGCPGKPTAQQGGHGSGATAPRQVRIVVDFPGDDIGGPEQRAALEALKPALERGLQRAVVSSGYGRGTVELVVEIADDGAMRTAHEVIRDVRPEARYRMEDQAP